MGDDEIDDASGAQVPGGTAPSSYQLLPFDTQQVQRSIVPVVSWDGSTLTCRGTAFAIHESGIFLTARHVVDDWIEAFGERTHQGTAGLFIVFETDIVLPSTVSEPDVPAALGGPLAVVGVDQHEHSDLALLQTQQAFHEGVVVPFPSLPLNFKLPSLGQKCGAVGYPRMRLTGDVPVYDEDAEPARELPQVDWDRRLAVSAGVIEQIHPVRRDSSLLSWPCFMSAAPYPKGLSGSPVVNGDGEVIGVVCSSTEGNTDVEVASYASLLAPALSLRVPIDSVEPVRSVLELVVLPDDLVDLDVADVDGQPRVVFSAEAIAREGLEEPTSDRGD